MAELRMTVSISDLKVFCRSTLGLPETVALSWGALEEFLSITIGERSNNLINKNVDTTGLYSDSKAVSVDPLYRAKVDGDKISLHFVYSNQDFEWVKKVTNALQNNVKVYVQDDQ